MRATSAFITLLCCLILNSCVMLNFDYLANKAQPTYEYHFEKYEPYLTIDSTYKTADEKRQFETLKRQFLETWLLPYEYKKGDTLKMKMYMSRGFRNYVEPEICYFNNGGDGFGSYSLVDVHIDNILHTKEFDTLLILATTVEVVPDSLMNALHVNRKVYKGKRARITPIKVLVDSTGHWQYTCSPGTFGIMSPDISKKGIERLNMSMKRAVIRGSYFRKNLTPDPTFWTRLFKDPNIFFPDPQKDGFPLN